MNTILLTQGYVAVVDDSDYELVSQYRWHAIKGGDTFYARTHIYVNGKRTTITMHRLILGLTDPKIHVDHINHNGLDNQRENIRACTPGENSRNRGKQFNNTSGLKGVYWAKHAKKWKSQIGINRKYKFLGYYHTPEEAHKAYCKAANELHGLFSNEG